MWEPAKLSMMAVCAHANGVLENTSMLTAKATGQREILICFDFKVVDVIVCLSGFLHWFRVRTGETF
jgi:hypothetical protein